MRGKKIEVNGIEIHYETVGNGPHVVLMLPGALGMSSKRHRINVNLKIKFVLNVMQLVISDKSNVYRFSVNYYVANYCALFCRHFTNRFQ